MERTHELVNLFHERLQRSNRTLPESVQVVDPFAESFQSVNGAAVKAVKNASKTILSTVKAMMSNHGGMLDLEGALMVADAELASASASARAFHDLMQKAKADLSRLNNNRNSLDRGDEELVSHYLSVSSLLNAVVDKRRLDLTICREELQSYKKDLSAPVSLWLCIDGSEGRSPQRSRVGDSGSSKNKSGVTILSSSSQLIAGVAEELLSGHLKSAAVTTDKMATALSSTVLGLARRTARLASEGSGAKAFDEHHPRRGAGTETLTSPTFVYSDEERQRLEQQRDQMLLEERIGNSASAKDIEATINELAQLTSMMQTRVLEQDEQLEGLEKTAVEATANIAKAADELKKPLKGFWNETMQMSALLWFLTMFILSLHYFIG